MTKCNSSIGDQGHNMHTNVCQACTLQPAAVVRAAGATLLLPLRLS